MSSHNRTQVAVQTDGSSEGLAMEEHLTQGVSDGPRGLCQATIDDLPDDVFLEIFVFYLDDGYPNIPSSVNKWHLLVHVCGRWRSLVFASPRRLDLRLLCTGHRSVRAMLDIWPALPIQISSDLAMSLSENVGTKLKNIIAALEHPDRVRRISIDNFPGTWEALTRAMQVPFPELIYLQLDSNCGCRTALPAGSAPRLRTLRLGGVPFSVVRGLLLSASDLVDLTIFWGSVSPESMVPCLSSLKRLESLSLRIPWSPDPPSPPPQDCAIAILPALTTFNFGGMSDCLEDLAARIDTPVLSRFDVSVALTRGLVFDIHHLRQFFSCARGLEPFRAASVLFNNSHCSCSIELGSLPRVSKLRLDSIDWDAFSMSLVCGQLSPLLSLVERLDLGAMNLPYNYDPQREVIIESTPLLELFRSCDTVQGLYVTQSLLRPVATALQGLIGERATEMLPNLRNLFLWSIPTFFHEVQPFLDARQLSGQPIAIHRWGEVESL